jgi:hypothetical protein
MPGNKRTAAPIVRALSARKQADFASPARTGPESTLARRALRRGRISTCHPSSQPPIYLVLLSRDSRR